MARRAIDEEIEPLDSTSTPDRFTDIPVIDVAYDPGNCDICHWKNECENGQLVCYCQHCEYVSHIGCTLAAVGRLKGQNIECVRCHHRARMHLTKQNCTRRLNSAHFLLRRILSILLFIPLVIAIIVVLGYIIRVGAAMTTNDTEMDDADFWLLSARDFLIGLILIPIFIFGAALIFSRQCRQRICPCCHRQHQTLTPPYQFHSDEQLLDEVADMD